MAAEIHVPEKGNLYVVKETLEKVRAFIDQQEKGEAARSEEIASLRSSLDPMSQKFAALEKRCDELDKLLPKGEKIFIPEGSKSRISSVSNFGRMFTAARRWATDRTLVEPLTRAQTEGTDTAGGVLVPVEVYPDVMRIVAEESIIRKIARVVPMASDKMTVPTVSTGPTVYWPGEATAPSESATTFLSTANSQLDTSTMAAFTTVSKELSEDDLVAIETLIAELFGEAMAKEENQQAFSATTPFTGVIQTSNVNNLQIAATNYSAITHTELVRAKFKANANVIHNQTWIFHPDFFQYVVSLKDGNQRPIWATSWASGATSWDDVPKVANATAGGILMGSPVYMTTVLPSSSASGLKFGICGDFSKFLFGDRRRISITWDPSVNATSLKNTIIVSERIALKALISGAFTTIQVG